MSHAKNALDEYWEALERLKKGQPKKVSKGSRINNDTVALEAGRRKGSIKKSRLVFSDLIEAIKTASAELMEPAQAHKDQLDRLAANDRKHRRLYEEALAREFSLLREMRLLQLEKQETQPKSAKVARLRR